MNQDEIVGSLRAEIAKLQRVLDLLLGPSGNAQESRRAGRPLGSRNKAASVHVDESAPRKRVMSSEGKARIAAAQKKRWAAQREAPPRRVAAKEVRSTKRTSKAVPRKLSGKTATVAAKKRARAMKGTGSAQAASA